LQSEMIAFSDKVLESDFSSNSLFN